MPTDEFEDDDRPRRLRSSRDDEDDAPVRRRNADDHDDFDDAPRKSVSGGNGLAITSMVLGIVSLVMVCCCYFIAPLLGLGALITGFMANSKGQSKGMAMAGIVTGALGVLGGLILIILVVTGAIQPVDVREFQKK
jgi:hypothetical protein